jgi:hypothetical protein
MDTWGVLNRGLRVVEQWSCFGLALKSTLSPTSHTLFFHSKYKAKPRFYAVFNYNCDNSGINDAKLFLGASAYYICDAVQKLIKELPATWP